MRSVFRALTLFCVALPSIHAFALDRQPSTVYHARRVGLAERLNGGTAILFAAEQPQLDFMPYRQDSDFYYLTGWNEHGAALLVEAAVQGDDRFPARPYREVLFLPTRNMRIERYTGERLGADTPGAAAKAGVDEVKTMSDLPSLLDELASRDPRALRALWSEPETAQAKS